MCPVARGSIEGDRQFSFFKHSFFNKYIPADSKLLFSLLFQQIQRKPEDNLRKPEENLHPSSLIAYKNLLVK